MNPDYEYCPIHDCPVYPWKSIPCPECAEEAEDYYADRE